MADKTLSCKDCGNDFVFTSGEQEFYTNKNFPDPIRCPDCRRTKKESKKNGRNNNNEEANQYMKNEKTAIL